jgi:hypothetical protein
LAILLTPFGGTALPYRGKLDSHDDIRVSYANQITVSCWSFYEHTNYIAGITFDGARWTLQPAAERSIDSGLAVSSCELRPAKWTATEN